MPIYSYEATNKEGEIESGELVAVGRDEAVAALTKKKLSPLTVEERQIKAGLSLSFAFFERFTALDRIILVRNLAATIKAGLSLLEALDILITDATKKITREILATAKTNVQNGQSLSAAFELYPKHFPPIFIGMVKAGEESGELDKTLEELSQQMGKEYALVKKVKSAMAYPLILLLASVAIVILLLVFVLPRLTKTFAQSQVELPLITRGLMRLSDLFSYSLWLDGAVIVGLVVFFSYFKKTSLGRRFFGWLAFSIPVSRTLVKKVVLVRLTRTLGSMIASAMPLLEALEMSARVAGNEKYARAIGEATDEVKNGLPLSETLRKYPHLFPSFLTSLVAVGEKTGTLENVLKTFADFYDEEVDGALKDLTTFVEPLLLLFMGLIIGLIAVSILMPIYQLVGKFV